MKNRAIAITSSIAWISMAAAVITAIIVTKETHCLWFMAIPAVASFISLDLSGTEQ